MISTKDQSLLPDRKTLETVCKAISALDAILCQDWQYRYYSFNSKWDLNERCLQMRNGSGDEMHVLFREDGSAINGFAHEYDQQDKSKLTRGLPAIFHEFIYGEPINSIGTTFCLWTTELKNWQVGQLESFEDNSEEMLNIFDGLPLTYIDWATEYYEVDDIPSDTVSKIYTGQPLTKQLVLSIVNQLEDWEQLERDLIEINYPYNFSNNAEKKDKKIR
jgi:hypothetical protein